jgi:glutamate/tyrosine decarboxylase-like PLP-dependent enzyme
LYLVSIHYLNLPLSHIIKHDKNLDGNNPSAMQSGIKLENIDFMQHERMIEENLDPQDWEAMRELGHQMVDDIMTYLEGVRERPVWQPMPEELETEFHQPVPRTPQAPEAVYQDFLAHVLPYPNGNIHPRFWGWVMGTGTPFTALAELLAAGMNPNVGGGGNSAARLEYQVLDWCKEMLGYPMEASGILVSGGSMANLVGLTVARNTKAEIDLRKEGLPAAPRRMVLYASSETHSSNQKAAELLGLGSSALRKIPVNEAFEIDVDALKAAITADKAAGHLPFCIIGHAGTVNTGAFDDLNTLADICHREGMWLHVDGAFGAWAALAPALRPLTAGMERADSVAFDLHKWMYMPYEAGCTLVRWPEDHIRSFTLRPDYLTSTFGGAGGDNIWLSDYGLQLSRGFKALKIWMSLKEQGADKFGRLIQQNVDQVQYLAGLVEKTPELELLAPTPLNIACFRYIANDLDDAALNELNSELLIQLQESGLALPSNTKINGKYAIRVANTNQRTRCEDFDLLIQEVLNIGKTLTN